ncbi:hypothetical protein OS493_004980 [Desmophyllum pertusum]|uniref:Uncharacterized protein n=1 Tax=Desmophyllum pertusum TaxID=174260 RepID=A0A9W9Z3S2_9CNID|nr:hypothetical protein OS493_004980 [Desmophyllum pertusum]
MADDIDDLLDECETKFCHSPNKPKQKPGNKNNSSSKKATRNELDKKLKSPQVKSTERDELHDMIRECMDDGPEIPELSDEGV